MPSVTLHLVLASGVLEDWKDTPSSAPFDPSRPDLRNAFQQGAVGPDLGYFPGGYRFLSDLSHLVRTGQLTRTLVETAGTARERAFAWGWVTHVLADQAIHPLVGKGVGEVLYGDRERFADSSRHQTTHVQVETGLDAWYAHRFPELRRRRMAPVFQGRSIRFLVDAYQQVYGISVDPVLVLSSHLAAARMSVRGLVAAGALSLAHLSPSGSIPGAGARWLIRGILSAAGRLGRSSLALAYLNPILPAPWLREDVDRVVEGFVPRFRRHLDEGCRELADYNLDSGQIDEPPVTHPGARSALEELARFRPSGRNGDHPPGHPVSNPRVRPMSAKRWPQTLRRPHRSPILTGENRISPESPDTP